jgi:mRNA interferase YafQ
LLNPKRSSQFKKDYKRYKNSGRYDIEKLENIMRKLINEEPLDISNNDHQLKGNLSDFRECHIEANWLLMYRIDKEDIIFTRTGSHAELFE